jgi:hypothetical protein
MLFKKNILIISIIAGCIFPTISAGQTVPPPSHLTTDLLEHTDRVFLDGYPTTMSLSEIGSAVERYQTAAIHNPSPSLGWIVNSNQTNTLQTAYRILFASSSDLLAKDEADLWDSGRTESDNSVSVTYAGKPLQPSTVYYWKVKIWDNHGGESGFSKVQSFITANKPDGITSRYPVQILDESPLKIKRLNDGCAYVDFGKAAWGRLKLTLFSDKDNDTVTVHLSEKVKDGRLDRLPGGSIRYSQYRLPLMKGTHSYVVKIRPDKRNTDVSPKRSFAILMPEYIGEVVPFRCCEIENYSHKLSSENLVRQTAHYPFDDTASSFSSSDTVLNRIWDLCKYSLKATTFTGVYIDGDRERTPYEREALISQLGHYQLDREYSIARYSHEHLLFHPTWPTEYLMQSVWIAWNDYLYTGNSVSLQRYYDDLKAKTLIGLRESNGLISTQTGKLTPEFYKSVHFSDGRMRDIVDWPHTGILGLGKDEGGETDAYVFTNYNTVVNAYHYLSLCLIAKIADAVGKTDDKTKFTSLAQQFKKDFNRLFLDTKKGYYKDGVDTEHCSLHANMFALAFGLVPEKNVKTVLDFIHSRQMACSISGALILMEALYEYHDADYALKILTSTEERSWYNTIRIGSTLTIEAWDNKYKPNLDWNQSAGAVPAYTIPRRLMGIEPLEPGYGKVRIAPQPSVLQHAEIRTPSIRGDISVSFDNSPGKKFAMDVEIPANMTAEILLPKIAGKYRLTVDDTPQKGIAAGNFVKVETGSGKHRLVIEN